MKVLTIGAGRGGGKPCEILSLYEFPPNVQVKAGPATHSGDAGGLNEKTKSQGPASAYRCVMLYK